MPLAAPIVNPPADLSGFDFAELPGSPTEEWTDEGFRATRELKIAWANRGALALALRGTTSSSGGRAVITRPQSYPTFPKAMVVACRCAPFTDRITALAGDTKRGNYEYAQVSVAYSAPKFDIDGPEGETFITESLEPVAEFLTLSHEKLYWDAGGTQPLAETEAPQKLIRMVDWVYTINKIDAVPTATFDLLGKVNAVAVISRTLLVTFPPETLLYNPPRLRREWTTEGNPQWTLEYRMTFRPDGWNKFFKRGVATPQIIYDAGGTQEKPYPTGDFTQLVG